MCPAVENASCVAEADASKAILTCHDEYLLHTMFDVDGALVGYGGIAPEPLIEMIAAGKAKDYANARALHDRLLPVTRNVYHRGSHMEGTVALKHALVTRGILEHATVRLAGAGEAGRVAVLDLLRARTRRFEVAFVLGLSAEMLPASGLKRRAIMAANCARTYMRRELRNQLPHCSKIVAARRATYVNPITALRTE